MVQFVFPSLLKFQHSLRELQAWQPLIPGGSDMSATIMTVSGNLYGFKTVAA